MRAIVSRQGGPLRPGKSFCEEEVPDPAAPTGTDLLVEVSAVSVNPIDARLRAMANDAAAARIFGFDAVGTVLAVGEQASGFAPGDTVFYAGAVDRDGSYAQRQLVDSRLVAPKPRSLSNLEAAALPLTALTAWECLFDKLRLSTESDGTLLVLGGAGGVGSLVIQLAKLLTGVRVIASASTPESVAWAKRMGADEVVDHSAPDLAQRVRELAPEGIDYAFSPHSAGRAEFFAEVMRPFSAVVAIDNPVGLDLLPLKPKSISWHWEFMFSKARFDYRAHSQGQILRRVAALADSGRLVSTLAKHVGELNAANLLLAHEMIESGHTHGKLVLGK
ncbi:zinc-binding alcohol dehydrogenase family protein [Dermabacteraceae bacterium CCM 9519]